MVPQLWSYYKCKKVVIIFGIRMLSVGAKILFAEQRRLNCHSICGFHYESDLKFVPVMHFGWT